jgi:uncharacterized protein (TIGR00251 family)
VAFTVRDTAHGAQFALRAQPRASRNAFAGIIGDSIKLAITAPPVDGKANQAVIQFLSDFFRVPKSNITIVSGETGKNKVVAIRGMSAEQVLMKLDV